MVQLQLRIIPGQNRTQPMIQALRSLMVPAQLDRGCEGCWLFLDALDARCLCYVEEWATAADLEREIRSARFTRLLSVMEEAPQAPRLEFRFVSQKRGLDFVAAVRLVNHQNSAINGNGKEP